MIRLPLALACSLVAAMAAVANAQYPQSQYAPGSAPGMGAGGAPGMLPGGAPASTPPGIFPGAAQYHARIPAPARPKLPRGVNEEGGLLYYNGKPYQEANLENMRQPGQVQLASYQQESPMGPPSVMSPAQGYPQMAQQQQAYGMQQQDTSAYGDIGSGNAYEDCNDPYCTNCGRPGLLHGALAWLHGDGRGFPGKAGSVWSAGIELVYYKQEHLPDRTLVFNTNSGAAEIQAQSFSSDYEPGFRTWLNYMGPSGISAQFIFLHVNGMDGNLSARGDNDLQVPFPFAAATTAFFGADRMTLDFTSNLNSFEANVVYPWSSLQLLAGYRYVQLDQTATLTAIDDDSSTRGYYRIPNCNNRLNGAQIGVLGQYEAFGLVNFDFVAKTGLYGNSTSQHQIVFDNGQRTRDTSGTDTDVAYVSELNARVVFPLGPTFAVQAGYDVLFINRVALATQQFNFGESASSGTQVSGGRNLIIHGISGGLTAKW